MKRILIISAASVAAATVGALGLSIALLVVLVFDCTAHLLITDPRRSVS